MTTTKNLDQADMHTLTQAQERKLIEEIDREFNELQPLIKQWLADCRKFQSNRSAHPWSRNNVVAVE